MMFGAPINSGLSLSKVIGGISKTLSIANQVIPLYKEAKPMINNARTILSVLKGFNSPTNNNNNKVINSTNNSLKTTNIKPIRTINNKPTFFL